MEVVTRTTINCTDCNFTLSGVVVFANNSHTTPGVAASMRGVIVLEAREHHRTEAGKEYRPSTTDLFEHNRFVVENPIKGQQSIGYLNVHTGLHNQDFWEVPGSQGDFIKDVLRIK